MGYQYLRGGSKAPTIYRVHKVTSNTSLVVTGTATAVDILVVGGGGGGGNIGGNSGASGGSGVIYVRYIDGTNDISGGTESTYAVSE